MDIRCHHLGMVAGFALALSLSAAADVSWSSTQAEAPSADPAPIVFEHAVSQSPPSPAPVLLIAGGLFGFAAYVRWRQRRREH